VLSKAIGVAIPCSFLSVNVSQISGFSFNDKELSFSIHHAEVHMQVHCLFVLMREEQMCNFLLLDAPKKQNVLTTAPGTLKHVASDVV
jgi:hypothetical protein